MNKNPNKKTGNVCQYSHQERNDLINKAEGHNQGCNGHSPSQSEKMKPRFFEMIEEIGHLFSRLIKSPQAHFPVDTRSAISMSGFLLIPKRRF